MPVHNQPVAAGFIQRLYEEGAQQQPLVKEATQWLLPQIAATAPQLLPQFAQPAIPSPASVDALLQIWEQDDEQMSALQNWIEKVNPLGSASSIITGLEVKAKGTANFSSEATGEGDTRSEISHNKVEAEGDVHFSSRAGKK